MWHPFKKPVRIAERRIDIAILATLWQPANPGQQSTGAAPPTLPQQVEFADLDIRHFWQQFIQPYLADIPGSHLQVIILILSELEKNGGCPSVVEGDEATQHPRNRSGVTLREHSLNVAREAYHLLRKRETDYQMSIGRLMIAVLAHDMGVCPAAVDPRWRLIPSHAFKSAEWLKTKLHHLRNIQEIIAAVQFHHDEQKGPHHPGNVILAILQQADRAAREQEAGSNAIDDGSASFDELIGAATPEAERKRSIDTGDDT